MGSLELELDRLEEDFDLVKLLGSLELELDMVEEDLDLATLLELLDLTSTALTLLAIPMKMLGNRRFF